MTTSGRALFIAASTAWASSAPVHSSYLPEKRLFWGSLNRPQSAATAQQLTVAVMGGFLGRWEPRCNSKVGEHQKRSPIVIGTMRMGTIRAVFQRVAATPHFSTRLQRTTGSYSGEYSPSRIVPAGDSHLQCVCVSTRLRFNICPGEYRT